MSNNYKFHNREGLYFISFAGCLKIIKPHGRITVNNIKTELSKTEDPNILSRLYETVERLKNMNNVTLTTEIK